MNIILDYGHRLTTPGKRTTVLPDRVIHERTFNEGYGKIAANLFKKAGCNVLEVAPDKNATMNEDFDLNSRVSRANQWAVQMGGESYYLSCHANAGGGQGAEVWIYSKADKGGEEEKLATAVLNSLCAATGMKNRGVKRGYPGEPNSNFAVNRYTTMTSMLIECGFMDYFPEANKMDSAEFQQICGKAVFDGVAKVLGLAAQQPEQPANGVKMYRVVFGAASGGDKNNAVQLGEKLGLKTTATSVANGLYMVEYSPMTKGDVEAIRQLTQRLQVGIDIQEV